MSTKGNCPQTQQSISPNHLGSGVESPNGFMASYIMNKEEIAECEVRVVVFNNENSSFLFYSDANGHVKLIEIRNYPMKSFGMSFTEFVDNKTNRAQELNCWLGNDGLSLNCQDDSVMAKKTWELIIELVPELDRK